MATLDSFARLLQTDVLIMNVKTKQLVVKPANPMNVYVAQATLVDFVKKLVTLVVPLHVKILQRVLIKVLSNLLVCVLIYSLALLVRYQPRILEAAQTIHVNFKEDAFKLFKAIVATVQQEELAKIVK